MDGPLPVTEGFVLEPDELRWRFSRSPGPGGQGVNTTDSRAELIWRPDASPAVARLSPALQERLHARLAGALVDGALVVAASEYRAQLRNRQAARERLVRQLRQALAAPAPRRRRTATTRGSVERRLKAKQLRSQVKARRGGRGADWS